MGGEAVVEFFQSVCPRLLERRTVTYFCMDKGAHKDSTIARVRDTTQVLVDVGRAGRDIIIQPLKVWDRYSRGMFKPHGFKDRALKPVKLDATRYAAQLEEKVRELHKIKNVLRESEEKYRSLILMILFLR